MGESWYSIHDLYLLQVEGLPRSQKGIRERAQIEGWKSRVVRGRGGPGGKRIDYQPPQRVLDRIHEAEQRLESYHSPDWKLPPGVESPAPSYAYIPIYNVAAGAAPNGRTASNERVIGELAFKEDWIRQEVRARPEDLRLIHVDGDSMEPDLRAGDIVLLDTTDTLAKREGIYVIKMDGALLVKALQRLPGGVVKVISRNVAYEPFTVTASEVENPNGFSVIGRVVWACRRF